MLLVGDEIGALHPERRAASLVFFIADETKEVLLWRHTRWPFVWTRSGVGGKFEPSCDDDIRDCAIRESEQELGVTGLRKDHLELVAVLVCETLWGKNRWVPTYAYRLPVREVLLYAEHSDGMDEFARYAYDLLPAWLKWWTQELVEHIQSGTDQCGYFFIANRQEDDRVVFDHIEQWSLARYQQAYTTIMQQ